MSQFGAPSFSLGLDLDLDHDLDHDRGGGASTSAAPTFRILQSDDECGESDRDGFDVGLFGGRGVGDKTVQDSAPRALKRLRRGPPVTTPSSAPPLMQLVSGMNVDEEIEEFSSDDDLCVGSCTTTRDRILRRSSKVSLSHQRVLSKNSSAKLGCKGSAPAFNSSFFGRSIATDGQGILPELTISPLRKIQCLDSDSDDDPSSSKCNQHKNEMEGPTQGLIRNNKTNAKFVANITEKEVHQKPLGHFATPVLDSFCEEYFASTKEKNIPPGNRCDLEVNISKSNIDCLGRPAGTSSTVNNFNGIADHSWSSTNYIPPCFKYYNHTDSRICELVQNRLPNFIPIGTEMQRRNQTTEMSNIDYMTQFLRSDTPAKNASKDNGSIKGTKKRERNVKNAKSKEPQIAGDWVNPKGNSSIPLDASKRRVHANANTLGHWITNQDGRKVYISKSGQELTGQAAYKHYRKESGMGFKKSGKKSVSKKRTKKQ